MTPLSDLQAHRWQILQKLWEVTDGSTKPLVDVSIVALGLGQVHCQNAIEYLLGEELIRGGNHQVGLTPKGVRFVEQRLATPEPAPSAPSVTLLTVHKIENSQVQLATSNSSQIRERE